MQIQPHRFRLNARNAVQRALLGAAALTAVGLSGSVAHAGGGIGDVRASVTHNSIRLDWTVPDNIAPGKYYVCYKPADHWDGACGSADAWPQATSDNGGKATTVTLVHGIQPSSEYKIKVLCSGCTKKGKHASQRKIGTMTLVTSPAPTDPSRTKGGLWITGSTHQTISVAWGINNPTPDDAFMICYTKRWIHPPNIGPFNSRDCIDNLPADARSYTISGLKDYKSYIITVQRKGHSKEFGETRGRTTKKGA